MTLAAMIIFRLREKVHSVTIFEAEKQVYWHIRLALVLRDVNIPYIDIVNRGFTLAQNLLREIHTSSKWIELRVINFKLRFSVVSVDFDEYNRDRRKRAWRECDLLMHPQSNIAVFSRISHQIEWATQKSICQRCWQLAIANDENAFEHYTTSDRVRSTTSSSSQARR
jgi:hypothetical protein